MYVLGEKRNTYTVLVGKHGGERPLGRHTCGRVDNNEMVVCGRAWLGLISLRRMTLGRLL